MLQSLVTTRYSVIVTFFADFCQIYFKNTAKTVLNAEIALIITFKKTPRGTF